MPSGVLVPREMVLRSRYWDERLTKAIQDSSDSLRTFEHAFSRRAPRQTDFIVTVMAQIEDALVPVGIDLRQINDDNLEGSEVLNTRERRILDNIVRCRRQDVIDWRYNDTFECVGGMLYREALSRMPPMTSTSLQEQQSFILQWYQRSGSEEIVFDREFRDLCRDVVNLRYSAVEATFKMKPSMFSQIGYVPKPDGPIRMRLVRRSVAHQAAAFADGNMMRLLHAWGVLQPHNERASLLCMAAASGNAATVFALIEMGYDVRTVNKHDTTALDMAIRNDRTDLVEILIRHGADVNRRDRSGRTTLFAARSVAVATILINAGAIVEICDNRGSSCVKHHLSDGRDDIADLLVSYGARVQPSSKREVSQEDVKNDGVGVLRRFFTKEHPKSLSDFELMATIDFGFVLPIGSVPLPGV